MWESDDCSTRPTRILPLRNLFPQFQEEESMICGTPIPRGAPQGISGSYVTPPATCQREAGHEGFHWTMTPNGPWAWPDEAALEPQVPSLPIAQEVIPKLSCPYCHERLPRFTWVTLDDYHLRVHYCERCFSVLSIETIGSWVSKP